jgi:flavodoxin
MKILIAYYSRTGTTKKAVLALSEKLQAEIEEIRDTADRKGIKGYLISGRDATKRRLTVLGESFFDPANFDLVIIGTPIWSWNLSVPARTYLENNKAKIKKCALLCTMGGSGHDRAAREVEAILGFGPSALIGLKTADVIKSNFSQELGSFASEIEKLAE